MATKTRRNDPCPCGSGKKYKNCHMRLEQLEREAAKDTRAVTELVGPETLPWEIFLMLQEANAQHLHAFYYELFHELGPMRARYPEQINLLQAADAGDEAIPGGAGFELIRTRVDDPDVHLLLAQNLTNPATDHVDLQLITLRPNGFGADATPRNTPHHGLRVWDVKHIKHAKDEIGRDGEIWFEDLGVSWHPREFVRGSVIDRTADHEDAAPAAIAADEEA